MRRASEPLPAQRPCWSIVLAVDPEYAALRHIGNLEFARLLQDARIAFNDLLISKMRGRERFSEQMIAHISMDFRIELFWTPEIEIYVRPSRIGRSSYELECTIWSGDRVAVHSTTVNVWMETDGPAPINDEARTLLASLN